MIKYLKYLKDLPALISAFGKGGGGKEVDQIRQRCELLEDRVGRIERHIEKMK